MLKLNLLFFQSQLELVFFALVKHLGREGARRDDFGDRGRGRCLALLPRHLSLDVTPRALPRELTSRVAPGRIFTLLGLHNCIRFYYK